MLDQLLPVGGCSGGGGRGGRAGGGAGRGGLEQVGGTASAASRVPPSSLLEQVGRLGHVVQEVDLVQRVQHPLLLLAYGLDVQVGVGVHADEGLRRELEEGCRGRRGSPLAASQRRRRVGRGRGEVGGRERGLSDEGRGGGSQGAAGHGRPCSSCRYRRRCCPWRRRGFEGGGSLWRRRSGVDRFGSFRLGS